MKRKIHKSDLQIVQKMYDNLVSFCDESCFYSCDISLATLSLCKVLDKKNGNNYLISAFYSFDTEEVQIFSLEDQEKVMLRLYNIVLYAFDLLKGEGRMDSFLGINPYGENNERHVWIRLCLL